MSGASRKNQGFDDKLETETGRNSNKVRARQVAVSNCSQDMGRGGEKTARKNRPGGCVRTERADARLGRLGYGIAYFILRVEISTVLYIYKYIYRHTMYQSQMLCVNYAIACVGSN